MDKLCSSTASIPDSATNADIEATWTGGQGLLSKGILSIDELSGSNVNSLVDAKINALIESNIVPKRPALNRNDSIFNQNLDRVHGNAGGGPEEVYPAKEYSDNARKFQNSVREEYCFYQARYHAAVSKFLSQMVSGPNDKAKVDTARTLALNMNQKVLTMVVMMHGLTRQRLLDITATDAATNNLNDQLRQIASDLRKHAAILKKESSQAQINARMVEFTSEKNRAHQNLISYYFILNVVAISSLFIIARSL